MTTYLAELYLPKAGESDVRDAARRARFAADEMTREGTPIRYLRALFVGDDETCFHLYETSSPQLVEEASRRAAIPVERVAEAVDIDLEALDSAESHGRSER